jgi:hypothetical protein
VQCLVRAVVVDRATHLHHPPVDLADSLGGDVSDRPRGVGPVVLRRLDEPVEEVAPVAQQRRRALGAQPADHLLALRDEPLLEQQAQRRDVRRRALPQPRRELAELEQLHVEVACRSGQHLQLAKAGAEHPQRLRREDAAQLALQCP